MFICMIQLNGDGGGWYARSRCWGLVYLQGLDGSFLPSEDLACALMAEDDQSPSAGNPKLFDQGAIERGVPEVLHELHADGLLPAGTGPGMVWATTLSLTYVQARGQMAYALPT